MDLAAVAAFTAAGLSLVNVGVSARLAGRERLEQWRRDVERPIVARMLTLSADGLEVWRAAAHARQEWIASISSQYEDPTPPGEDTEYRDKATDDWRVGSEVYEKLRFEMAQLELIAGRPLRDVARKLLRQHEAVRRYVRPSSGADDWFTEVTQCNNEIVNLHGDLQAAARVDLGLDRGIKNRRLQSILRRFRLRRYGMHSP